MSKMYRNLIICHPFWEIGKRIGQESLDLINGSFKKNSGLERARIISKRKTTVHENSFANPFSDSVPISRSS